MIASSFSGRRAGLGRQQPNVYVLDADGKNSGWAKYLLSVHSALFLPGLPTRPGWQEYPGEILNLWAATSAFLSAKTVLPKWPWKIVHCLAQCLTALFFSPLTQLPRLK